MVSSILYSLDVAMPAASLQTPTVPPDAQPKQRCAHDCRIWYYITIHQYPLDHSPSSSYYPTRSINIYHYPSIPCIRLPQTSTICITLWLTKTAMDNHNCHWWIHDEWPVSIAMLIYHMYIWLHMYVLKLIRIYIYIWCITCMYYNTVLGSDLV